MSQRIVRLVVALLVGLAVTCGERAAAHADPQPALPTSVAVSFDASASTLPQDDIRAAISRELGAGLAASGAPSERELTISVTGGEVTMSYRSPEGVTERRLPLSQDPAQIQAVLSLLAVNLVRDQRALVQTERAPAPAATPAPPPTPAPAPVPAPAPEPAPEPFARHWLGFHFAQDLLYRHFTGVCNQTPGQDPTYTCYDQGSGAEYVPSRFSGYRSTYGGISVATQRLLLSYDYAFTPQLTLGGRAGYAFGGGPAAGGTPFLPLHLEVRGTFWYAPLTNSLLRAYVGPSLGIIQIDAKAKVGATCTLDSGVSNTDACGPWTDGTTVHPGVALDGWKKVGQAFVGVHTGVLVHFVGSFSLEANLDLIAAVPNFGFAMEPSLGVVSSL